MKLLQRASGVAALLVLASGAAAQSTCDWYVRGVADFDQRRMGALPGDGSMYCVPTSTCNWLAHVADHGYPAVFSGPRSWQSQANYNYVSGRDAYLGGLMGTSATGGTGGDGWLSGAAVYLWLTAPFKFEVTADYSSPTELTVFADHILGGMTAIAYGRYTLDSPNHYTRSGGHVISLVGMRNECSAGQTVFRVRDPADDADNTTQSPFATADIAVQPVTAFFRGDSTQPYVSTTLVKLTPYSTPCFFDGMVTIWPTFGLSIGSSNLVDTIRILRPVQLDSKTFPVTQDFSTPTGGSIRDVAMHAQMDRFYYITGPAGANPTRLFKFDPTDGVSTPLGTSFLTNPTRLATSRQGEVFALDSGMVFEVPETAGATAPPSTSAQGADTLTFDDFSDLLVGLDAARRTILLWHRGFVGGFGTLALPPDVCLNGRAWITVSPADGALWLASGQCQTLYKLVGGGANPLSIADMVPLPPGANPAGLNVTRHGHVLFSSGGQIVEMEKVNGVWINSPISDFAGLNAGPFLCLAKSRSNFDPATMNGPGYRNLVDPEVLPETPDCYANCDGSTVAPVLNVNDFTCFLGLFASGNPDANCDESTTPPVLNVNDFTCFINKFATGCP